MLLTAFVLLLSLTACNQKSSRVNNAPGAMPSASIYQLEVWTSTEMPKSVNFLRPLYIKEDAGIMKILIQYQEDSPLKFLYEFAKVEDRSVTTDEMQIQKTAKIHDFGKDKMTVGMEMMGIVFGLPVIPDNPSGNRQRSRHQASQNCNDLLWQTITTTTKRTIVKGQND